MKMNLKLVLSYGGSGKGNKVNMRDIHAVIHLYHVLKSVLVDINNMVTLEYFVRYTEDRSYVRIC